MLFNSILHPAPSSPDVFKFSIRHTVYYVRHLTNGNCHSSTLDLGKDAVSLAGGVVNLLKIWNLARNKKKSLLQNFQFSLLGLI